MAQRLQAFEQLMVMMEKSNQPMHASSMEILKLPKDAGSDYVQRFVDALREVEPCDPFDKTISGALLQRWNKAQPDMHYHVRHVQLPAPGTMVQLMEMAEGLYGGLLNHSLPLWEAWVIEGLEGGRFALLFKAHHSLTDGIRGMRMYFDSLATNSSDIRVRAPWGDNHDSNVHTKIKEVTIDATQPIAAGSPSKAPRKTAKQILGIAESLWPVKTHKSRLNGSPVSSARRFGFCRLSLAHMKEIRGVLDCTVNDILVTVIDHAVHRYLSEIGDAPSSPLAVLMAVSGRKEGQVGGASNQVVAIPAKLAPAELEILPRLMCICESLKDSKYAASELPSAAQTGYTAVAGALMPALLDKLPSSFGLLATSSIVVSNISPPRSATYVAKPLYRNGAVLEDFIIQPIINSSCLLNVTGTGYNKYLHLGIASVPSVIDDPLKLGRYLEAALQELKEASAAL